MTIEHLVLDASIELENEVFRRGNIELAWMRMKQRFPLLATSVDELPGSEVVEFVLEGTALFSLRPGEVNLISNLDSTHLTNELLNGPPVLTNEITAKLWIGQQKDVTQRHHAFITAAPYIMDGILGATLLREFCQELTSLSKEDRFQEEPLAKRLYKSLPVEGLHLRNPLNLSQLRWRSAAAKIINKLRQERREGEHTLPALRPVHLVRPALTRTVSLRLPARASQAAVSACRTNCISFGSALPVLSQLALTLVLHRHRNNAGDRWKCVSNREEYGYQLVHPMRYATPLYFTDYKWYETGAAKVGFSAGFHDVVLLPMAIPKVPYPILQSYSSQNNIQSLARWLEGPRDVNTFLSDGPIDPGDPWEFDGIGDHAHYSKASFKGDGLPSFASLLSQQLFLDRARTVFRQSSVQLRHPLLHELHAERMLDFCRRARARALAWRAKQADQSKAKIVHSDAQSTFSEQGGLVMIDIGSILGDRVEPLPTDYPLSPSSFSRTSPILLHVVESEKYLRCPPGHVYLDMRTLHGELTFTMCFDANVFDTDLVREWLEEIRSATMHYLAGGKWNNDDGARVLAKL